MKQFIRSKVAIACYVISVLIAAYCLYVCASAIGYVNQYFASMGMPANFGVTLEYILQSGLSPLVSAITVFMAGFILEEVRKLIDDCYAKAKEMLENNIDMLHKTAELLLEKDKITGEELDALFSEA